MEGWLSVKAYWCWVLLLLFIYIVAYIGILYIVLGIIIGESDGYVFVNIIDKEGKNNLYKYSKSELTDYIEKTTKNLELFKKEPLAFMKMKAQMVAIDSYLINNKLTF